ncbi:MFS transporter, partial [Acidithiobacillus thiooxidans]|nr:MFS transporter [Acidithiobacillus thiooxidans]
QWHWFRAAKTILSIPSNVVLISASSAGYFYFTGLLAFGILYLTQRFHINTMAASSLFVGAGLGGIGGVIASGWIADWLLRKGLITARVWVTGIAFLLTIPFFLLALNTNNQVLEFIWLFWGSAALGATNPTLDAARLDIMHSRLWGRAEGIRISLRYILEAAAPFAFGWVSTHFSESHCQLQHCGNGYGLHITFGLFTILLLVATILMLSAIFTYPRDVATALFSHNR